MPLKRVQALLFIAVACLYVCAPAHGEFRSPALSAGKSAADFGGQSVLIVHYRREAADYTDWNVWAWPVGGEGQAFSWTGSDAFGVYAVAVFEQVYPKLGFLIRRGDWLEKDVSEDRLVELGDDGIAEVWVHEGRLRFDTHPPLIDQPQADVIQRQAHSTNLPSSSYKPVAPRNAAEEGSAAVVVLHYHRPDGMYAGWDVWAWPEGREGRAYAFEGSDDFGVYARISMEEPTDRVGFIVRRNGWQHRDVEMDRFVTLNPQGVAEAWLLAGEERVYMNPAELDYSVRIQRAFLDTPDLIHVRLNRPGKLEAISDPPGWVEVSGHRYSIKQVKRLGHGEAGTRDLVLILAEPIALERVGESMTLHLPGIDPAIVYARDILMAPYFHDLGATLGSDCSSMATAFATWSPVAEQVELLLYRKPGDLQPYAVHPMRKGTGSVWRVRVEGDLHGVYYTYRFTSYGEQREVPDIYCFAATKDSSRSMVVDLDRTDPAGWEQDVPPVAKSPTDEVIYEIHVRDYSIHDDNCPPEFRGKYLGLAQPGTGGDIATGIAHLKELGVTTVHLLPIQDFSAGMDEYNWGYWTALFNVPEAQYSTNYDDPVQAIRDLKTMILELHRAGIRVVLDVVYNHTSSSFASSPFDQAVPWYYFRTTPGGRLRNESGTGNAIADERPMVRKYILDSLKYWVREYHADGFRFDLLGMMHKETVEQFDKELHAIRDDLILYGEPWTGGGPTHFPKGAQKKMRVAVFNDHFRNAIRGDLDGVAKGFVMGGGHIKEIRNGLAGAIDDFTYQPGESINYVSAHDNRTLWDKLTHTLPDADDVIKRKMHKLALGLVLTAQGVAFLHGGSDFCRTKHGNHNSYNAGDEVNHFDWARKETYRDVFEYTAGLIRLRRDHPAFRITDRKLIRKHMRFHDGTEPVWFTLDGQALGDSWSRILCAYNGEAQDRSIDLPEGLWHIVVDHERAGIEPLGEVSGSYTLPAHSMTVLYQP